MLLQTFIFFLSRLILSPDPNQLLGSHMQQTCTSPAPLLSVHTSSTLADKALPWLPEAHNLCSCQTVTRGVTHFKLAALCGRTNHPPPSRGGGRGPSKRVPAHPKVLLFSGHPTRSVTDAWMGEFSASQNWHLTLPLKSATSLQG